MTGAEPQDPKERRLFPRIFSPSIVYISQWTDFPEEVHVETAVLHDISEGGLSFITALSYNLSDVLNIEVRLPGIIHAFKGSVLRSETMDGMNLVAIAFVDMSPEHVRELHNNLSF